MLLPTRTEAPPCSRRVTGRSAFQRNIRLECQDDYDNKKIARIKGAIFIKLGRAPTTEMIFIEQGLF